MKKLVHLVKEQPFWQPLFLLLKFKKHTRLTMPRGFQQYMTSEKMGRVKYVLWYLNPSLIALVNVELTNTAICTVKFIFSQKHSNKMIWAFIQFISANSQLSYQQSPEKKYLFLWMSKRKLKYCLQFKPF